MRCTAAEAAGVAATRHSTCAVPLWFESERIVDGFSWNERRSSHPYVVGRVGTAFGAHLLHGLVIDAHQRCICVS